jgi:hypothetical protein
MAEQHGTNQQQAGYDKTDVNITKIVGYSFTIVIVLIAIIVFLYEVFIYSKEQAVYELVLSPESKMLRELRAREDQQLNSYKILDEEKGIYQIPIDQAIEVVSNEAYEKRLEEVKTP